MQEFGVLQISGKYIREKKKLRYESEKSSLKMAEKYYMEKMEWTDNAKMWNCNKST